jgi:hypothetical protein
MTPQRYEPGSSTDRHGPDFEQMNTLASGHLLVPIGAYRLVALRVTVNIWRITAGAHL